MDDVNQNQAQTGSVESSQSNNGSQPVKADPFQGFPKADVRTMSSDIKSVQETGGGAPKPYSPSPAMPSTPSFPSPASFSEPKSSPSFPMPPVVASPIKPPSLPNSGSSNFSSLSSSPSSLQKPMNSFSPPSTASTQDSLTRQAKSGGTKKIFAMILSLILVVGIGAVGYFFVWPLFQKNGSSQIAPVAQTPSDEVTPLAEVPSLEVAPVNEQTQTSVNKEDLVAADQTEQKLDVTVKAPPLVHVSFLKTPADLKNDLSMETIDVASIRNAIGFTTADVSSLKEVVLKSSNEALPLSSVGKIIAPSFFNSELLGFFEDDFTLTVFTDSSGSWPVYLLKIRSDANSVNVDSKIKSIESLTTQELANFFASDPGNKTTWKTGAAGGVNTRYNTFSQVGAGLNYGRRGSIVIIGTSYAAFKEVIGRLSE